LTHSTRPSWYRSLYWRIALGFVALLAAVLVAQALFFVWLTGRIDQSPAGRTPQQLADYVARQLSTALSDDPALELDSYVRAQFGSISRPFAVAMFDGTRVSNRPDALPEGFPGPVPRFGGRDPRGGGGRGGRPDLSEGQGPGGAPGGGRGGPGRRRQNSAPVVVNGVQVGIVAVPPSPAAIVALNEFGPTLAAVGLALLIAGASAAALLIFGPARRRLRSLETAARALGEGRSDVRANETGGDEVAVLAKTFNRMTDDLQARAHALEQADRARRQLLADVSHELMTPLTAIRGYVQTLSMPSIHVDDETRGRYLSIVDQETYKLEAIIGDLLDLARIEGGGEKPRRDTIAVDALFTRVIERHLPEIRSRDITTRVDVASGTPPLIGHAGRLEQALQNLASNSIRHMPDGGTLSLQARVQDGEMHITVRDTGPGIPDEHVPHIFDRFYKADASRAGTRIRSGSGLGLSIVRAIVEHHRGHITAANSPEGGAVFTLTFPAEFSGSRSTESSPAE
jgi:two-component system, OmpR family, sensor kinase